MNGSSTSIRGAPDRARRLLARLSRTGYRAVALGFAATLLASTAVVVPSVGAQPPAHPTSRLQVVLKKIHVYDDRDWGDGEMAFYAGLREVSDGPVIGWPTLAGFHKKFSAGSGDDVILEQLMPGSGGQLGSGSSPEGGMPVFADRQYMLVADMYESDSLTANEHLGFVRAEVNAENGWALGTHTVRSSRPDGKSGDFSLTFEIRVMPLSDLHPVGFRVNSEGIRDRDDQVCFTIQNLGPEASAPFRATIAIDGAMPPVTSIGAFGLAAGETREQCTTLYLPDTGNRQLTLTADAEMVIPELDETNNVYQQILVRSPAGSPGPIASGTPDATSSASPVQATASNAGASAGQAQADLTVSAIRVNGQAPDGKSDCKDGKSVVAVVVKNLGAADAESVGVRLVVDDGDPIEKSVGKLEAGKERELRFEDVRLKKGEHQLAATVDPKKAVAESNEENNGRSIMAGCTAGD